MRKKTIERKLTKRWNDLFARYEFTLIVDGYPRAFGNEDWAVRVAQHYAIPIPKNEEMSDV